MFINDVGQSTWEEINEAGAAGANYGWPTTEGPTTDPRFRSAVPLLHARGRPDCAITGGAFYNPPTANFPAEYVGDYFFADYCSGWIRGSTSPTKAVSTLSRAGRARRWTSTVGRATAACTTSRAATGPRPIASGSSTPATPPAITTQPSSRHGRRRRSRRRSRVSATGTAPLRYQWQRNGVDIPGATASTLHARRARTLADNGAQFRVVVTNASGSATSNAATLTVTTNRPPVRDDHRARPAGTLYSAGDTIAYAGTRHRPGGRHARRRALHLAGRLPPRRPHPPVPAADERQPRRLVHDPDDGANRRRTSGTGSTSPSATAAASTASTYRDVLPRTARVTLATSVPGLGLELDGQPVTAPHTLTGVAGIQRKVAAPATQVVAGRVYVFLAWSDGGAASHTIATPATDATFTATYVELPPPLPGLPGLPVTATGADPPPVVLTAPERTRWRQATRRGIPVRVSAPAGTRVLVALRRGERRLAALHVSLGAGGAERVRLRVRAKIARRAGRRALRLEASAAAPDGRRSLATRRIVLTRR